MTTDDPDWNLLPHDPLGFFQLSDPFQRNDLKRAYTRLLKKYKPETCPSEFQRLRAAFEQLDFALRYGDSGANGLDGRGTGENIPTSQEPPTKSTNLQSSRFTADDDRGAPVDAVQQGATQPLEAYTALVQSTIKRPVDYWWLAVLSDVAQPGESGLFVEWILCGLRQFPTDMGLLRLLHAQLDSGANDNLNADFLVKLCGVMRNEYFFAITEPLWRRLLADMPFAEIAALLEKCEALIRDVNVRLRVVFYVQLLRSAMFIAPTAWIKRTLTFITENNELIPRYSEMDYEVTRALARYRLEDSTFAQLDGVRHYIHQAMVQYCGGSAWDGNEAVVEVNVAAARSVDHLMASFPIKGEDFRAAREAWEWISLDVFQRLAMRTVVGREGDDRLMASSVVGSLVAAHDVPVRRLGGNVLWHMIASLLSIFVGLIVGLMMAVGWQNQRSDFHYMAIMPTLFLTLYWLIGARHVRRALKSFRTERLDVLYANSWRPVLLKGVLELRGNYEILVDYVGDLAASRVYSRSPVVPELDVRLKRDAAVAFYGTAVRFGE